MKTVLLVLLTISIIMTAGCNSANVISEEEMKIQNAASEAVTGLLFDNDMDNLASYNVRKNGHVVLKFHESVKKSTYTDIVNKLRNTSGIKSVYAEQGGVEICNQFNTRM